MLGPAAGNGIGRVSPQARATNVQHPAMQLMLRAFDANMDRCEHRPPPLVMCLLLICLVHSVLPLRLLSTAGCMAATHCPRCIVGLAKSFLDDSHSLSSDKDIVRILEHV